MKKSRLWLKIGIGVASLCLITVIAMVVLMRQLGLSTDIQANLDVATGMSAKLACSGYHLTGLPKEQLFADIDSYAPISGILRLGVNDNSPVTHATVLRNFIKTATYRPGLGCTLNIGDTSHLDALHIPEVLPNTAPWPVGQTVATLNSTLQDSLASIMARDNAAGLQTRALVAVHNNQIVAETYADGFDQKSQLLGWSMGKSVTAMLMGHLAQEGQMDAAQNNLFTAWANDERRTITLKQLLNMSSGLDFDETYAPGSDATYMLFNAPSASDVAMESSLAHAPGEHFSYSSGTTNLLMRYLADSLGGPQALLDLLYEGLLEPLNLADTTFEVDPSGILVGSSYIYASARDWAKLGLLMLNKGTHADRQLIAPDWISASTRPNTSSNDPRYGYQFWLNSGGETLRWPQLPEDAYAMNGNRGQSVMIIPSRNVVLVRLGWSATRYPTATNFEEILATLAALDAQDQVAMSD